MRECSLHFDFSNAEGKLDLNKAEALMEMALKLGLHTFNTYWDQEVYPEKEAEDQEFADQIHALAVRKGMKLSSYHFVGSVLDEEDPEQKRVRHYMQKSLDIYSVLDPGVFVVHPGTFSDGGFKKNKIVHQASLEKWGAEETHRRVVENLRWFGQRAAEKGIRLAVENIYGGRFYSQIDELIALVEEVNLENVGFCLDVGHANVDGVDIPAAIQRMGKKLYEVHLHDNNGKKDQHLPIGFGTVNWIEVIEALKAIDYPGTATFEFFRWPMPDYEQGLTRAVEMWRTLEFVQENGYFTTNWN